MSKNVYHQDRPILPDPVLCPGRDDMIITRRGGCQRVVGHSY